MNDKLKPNQEKRIIENCVESIMDDLDYYHFDELIMEQYEKELFQLFTKISEEHSIFSPISDFSNKKNIVNDKEKINKALKVIDKMIRFEQVNTKRHSGALIGDLKEIQKILED